jgi:hypothetical protein
MKAKAIFLIIWKTWKNYKILRFYRTMDAWKYVHDNKIQSYSVYWANKSLDHSNSTSRLRDQIEQILKDNPEVMVNWNPSPLSH